MATKQAKRFRRPSHWTLAQVLAHHTAAPNAQGCTLWIGKCLANGGYGLIQWDGRLQRAHRLAWISARGPIPNGMLACHKCDTPACLNVDHLFLGTTSDNARDMVAKGRCARVFTNGYVKLTASEVLAIRSDARPQSAIARQYGIPQPHVSRIKRGLRWGHL